MKRYISLVLVAVVLVMSLAVPSYAAEPVLTDLLDITSFNEDGSNVFNVSDYGRYTFPNSKGCFKYIDLVIRFASPQNSVPITFYPHNFGSLVSPTKIDSYTYRWVFSYSDPFPIQDFEFMLRGDVVECQAEILSCRVSTNYYNSYDCPLTGYIEYGSGDESSFYYNNWDDYTGVTLYGSSDFNYDQYWSYVYINDWKKYDYIDLQVYLSELSLSSLTATLDGLSVPFSINYLNSESSMDVVAANIMLDLTSVRRDLDGPLELSFTGSVPVIDGRVGRFVVMHSFGFVSETISDPESAFFYKLKSFFTDLLSLKFDSLGSGIIASISEWGQKIVNAINPDLGNSNEVINQGSQAADQLTDLTDQMDSLEKPDLSGAGDISAIISPGDLSSYTVFLSTVVNAPYIGQVVMLSLILSLAAYVLFGKR